MRSVIQATEPLNKIYTVCGDSYLLSDFIQAVAERSGKSATVYPVPMAMICIVRFALLSLPIIKHPIQNRYLCLTGDPNHQQKH